MESKPGPTRLLSRALFTDLLFLVQAGAAGVFGVSQAVRLVSSQEGVNVTWFLYWLVFLLLNVVLTARAHAAQPSRITIQSLLGYVWWSLFAAAGLVTFLVQSSSRWDSRDSITTAGVAVTVAALALAYRGLPLRDPILRGSLALAFKSVPQVVLAVKIAMEGGSGIAGLAILTGHVTICARILQLAFSIREAGWDRNRRGSLLSELGNEASWLLVTVLWLTA
ncbi:MAG: hypothetical protein EXR48_05625 [Dehalococcoidia bacterium]|nr:hypothetical protein [Dehalococcoidia bacterium]